MATWIRKRDLHEHVTDAGDLIIARRLTDGDWLITAHTADLSAQVQHRARFNEAGFGGRQWEYDGDGQQHPTLKSAMLAALSAASLKSAIGKFIEDLERSN